MPHLECTIDHLPYAGTVHKLGERFFASDEDARLLKGFGKARDVKAGEGSQSDPAQSRQRRGRYNRADMRPEE